MTKYAHLVAGSIPNWILTALGVDLDCDAERLSAEGAAEDAACKADPSRSVEVTKGMMIGTVGNSQYIRGLGAREQSFKDVHLHFEIRQFDGTVHGSWYKAGNATGCSESPPRHCGWTSQREMDTVRDVEELLPPLPASWIPTDPGGHASGSWTPSEELIREVAADRQVIEIVRGRVMTEEHGGTRVLNARVSAGLWRPLFYSRYYLQEPRTRTHGIAGTRSGVDRYFVTSSCDDERPSPLRDPVTGDPALDEQGEMAPAGELPRTEVVLKLRVGGSCTIDVLSGNLSYPAPRKNSRTGRWYVPRTDIQLRDPYARITWAAELGDGADQQLVGQSLNGNAINLYTFTAYPGLSYSFCTRPETAKSLVPLPCSNETSSQNVAELLLIGPDGEVGEGVSRTASGLQWQAPASVSGSEAYTLLVRRRDREIQAGPNLGSYVYALQYTVPEPGCRVLPYDGPQGASEHVCPAAPKNPRATNVMSTTANLSWDSVGDGATYQYRGVPNPVLDEPSKDCDRDLTDDTILPTTTLASHFFERLVPATEYVLCVRVIGSIGPEADRGTITSHWAVTTTQTKLPAPTIDTSRVIVTDRVVTLAWNEVDGADGYDVKRTGDPNEYPLSGKSNTSRLFDTLEASSTYTFSVRAKLSTNDKITSAWTHHRETTLAPAIAALEITSAEPAWRHCVKGAEGVVPVDWVASGGVRPYTVAGVEFGAEDTTGTIYLDCPASAGAGRIEFMVADADESTEPVTGSVQITATEALTFELDESSLSCETYETITIGWMLSGGTADYTISGTGLTDVAASSGDYTCPATAQTLSLTINVSDASMPVQQASQTLTLQVTQPVTVTGVIRARLRANGFVEYDFLPGEGRVLDLDRRFKRPAEMTPGVWTQSSVFSVEIDELRYTVGQLSVRLSCAGYIEATLLEPDGTRRSPAMRNFYYKSATVNAWQRSGELTLTLSGGAGGSAGESGLPGALMDAAAEGTHDPPGTDGGLMAEASEVGGAEAVSTAPCVPEQLNAVALSTTSLRLSWGAAPGATAYQVKRTNAETPVGSSATTSHDFSGLTSETEYTLYVRSQRGTVVSDWASMAASVPAAELSGRLRARRLSDGRLEFEFRTSAGDSIQPERRFKRPAELSPGVWTYSEFFTETVDEVEYTVGRIAVRLSCAGYVEVALEQPDGTRMLPSGRSFFYQTATVNAWRRSGELTVTLSSGATGMAGAVGTAGALLEERLEGTHDVAGTEGGLMAEASGVAGASVSTLPCVPEDASLGSVTSSSARLSWSAAPGAVSYEVMRTGATTPINVSTATAYSFSGLAAGTEYTFSVRSRNASGVSGWAEAEATTVPPAPVPSVSGVTASAATLNWTGSKGATSYEVRRGTRGAIVTKTAGARNHFFSGLSAGTRYVLYVLSRNANGASDWVSATTTPAKPTGLQVTGVTADGARLSWTATRGATSYEVRRTGATTPVGSSSTMAHEFSGLAAGTQYTFSVRARNASGVSGWAEARATTIPTQPTGLQVTGVTASGARLSWTAVRGATSYEVKRTGATTPVGSSSTTAHEFSGLAASTQYTFSVRARNASGRSGWAEARATTLADTVTVTSRMTARIRGTGRVEFGFRPQGGERILPSGRYVSPAGMTIDRWVHSSVVVGSYAGHSRLTMGTVSVRKRNNLGYDYIDICFTPSGADEAICPSQNNFRYETATVDRWLRTGDVTFIVSLGGSGSSGASDPVGERMSEPTAAEPDTPGTEGGRMDDD